MTGTIRCRRGRLTGRRSPFVSQRGSNANRTNDTNIFVVDARAGAQPRALTTWNGPDNQARPAWSPDGASIAYLQGSEPKLFAYSRNTLAVVPAAGGTPTLLTDANTIDVEAPAWTPDGTALYLIAVNDRARELVRVAVTGGPLVRLTAGRRVVRTPVVARDGRVAVIATTGTSAPEVHGAVAGAGAPDGVRELSAISHQNDVWLAGLLLGGVEDFAFVSPDGTKVGAILVKPVGFEAGRRYPLILYIHGGPNGQDQHGSSSTASGSPPRAMRCCTSTIAAAQGRVAEFQSAIFGDWGHNEVVDLLAGVDLRSPGASPIRRGSASAAGATAASRRITRSRSDPRFKAAVSGAGSSLQTRCTAPTSTSCSTTSRWGSRGRARTGG